jgi:hypothetical protein
MNHRLGMRKPVNMDVMLEDASLGLIHCVAEDIGAGGMFVRSQSIYLYPNTTVSVLFNTGAPSDETLHRLPARVVWSRNDGAGLMFTKYTAGGMDALHRLLSGPGALVEDPMEEDGADDQEYTARVYASA